MTLDFRGGECQTLTTRPKSAHREFPGKTVGVPASSIPWLFPGARLVVGEMPSFWAYFNVRYLFAPSAPL